ncbi:hypothetical protein ASB1_17390 [Helicobacter heilmannii]|nr:hypothetical protein ASB1_17390 [Helicobacter heilmannii]
MNTRYCSFCSKPENTLPHHRRLVFSSKKSGKDIHICEYCVEVMHQELHIPMPGALLNAPLSTPEEAPLGHTQTPITAPKLLKEALRPLCRGARGGQEGFKCGGL